MTSLTICSLFRLGSTAAACSLLLACGGGNDGDSPGDAASALKAGDSYSVDVLVGENLVNTHDYLLHGVTRNGELVADNLPGLVPGALIPLPAEPLTKAAGDTSAPSHAALRSFYKQLWDATAAHEGTNDPALLALELADLDTDIPTLQADLARSQLHLAEYVAFYDALDEVPQFQAQEDAESQLLAFFDAVNDIELQGVSCQRFVRYPVGHRCLEDESQYKPKADVQATLLSRSSQRDLLHALDLHRLSWVDFLKVMDARGDDFHQLALRYRDWAPTVDIQNASTPLHPFITAYLQPPVAKAADLPDQVTPRNAEGEGTVKKGIGALRSLIWDIVQNSEPVFDAASTQNFILSPADANPLNYAGAKKGASDPVVIKFRSDVGTWAEARYQLDGLYDASHQTLPGRWMPQLNINVIKTSAHRARPLNIRAHINHVLNAGSDANPVPLTHIRVDVAQGSFFNAKPQKSVFEAKGNVGFWLLNGG